MNWSILPVHTFRQSTVVLYALAVTFSIWVPPTQAGQVGGQFVVSVKLQTTSSPTLCRNVNPPGAIGATVIVVCSAGATVHVSPSATNMPWSPIHGGAPRYNFLPAALGNTFGMSDGYGGAGTVTTWRVVQFVDWDYLEMLMSW